MNLFAELKRRKVFRVAVVYAATAFVVLQAADLMLPRLAVPDWALTLVVVFTVLGFPIALVLAWALEISPDGIRRTGTASANAPAPALLGKRTLVAAALLVAIGAGIGAGWFLKPSTPAAAAHTAGSVAVLPFDNFGNDQEDYFSDGITEDIIAQLTRVPDLTVVSRTSAMRYRGTSLSIPEIGRELSVGAVLEGSVRRADGRVRIVAQLVDVATDTHLWVETYDREIADVFEVQTEVAREIASALGRTLIQSNRADAGASEAPADPETYELYLRGRHLWHTRRVESVYGAIEYFRQAIQRDPDFALAYVALADAYVTLTFSDPSVATLDWLERAEAALQEALALDPDLGEAHAALGLAAVVARDWDAADEHLDRALDLTPGYVSAHHWHGVWMSALGRYDEAAHSLRRALELDPFSTRLHRDMALVFLWGGRPTEAVPYVQRGTELEPGFGEYYLTGFMVYSRSGMDAAALEALLRANEFSAGRELSAEALRSAFRTGGLHAAVRLALDRAPDMFGFGMYRAAFQLYVGETDAAVQSLERMVDRHDAYSAWIAADPVVVEALGEDPRFQALVRRLGVPRS